MLRFTNRDVLWAIALAAAVAAWWAEHRKYNAMAIAANNQETALHLLISYLVEKDDWKITTTEGHLEVRLPGDKPGQ